MAGNRAFSSKIGPMQKTTVITFDADGTLWDFRLMMRRALSHVLVALRQAVPVPAAHALTVDDMVGIRNDAAQASHLRCSQGTEAGFAW